MKKDIHPQYFPKAQVKCACGNSFTVGSTKEKIEIEICSACHPFYTGKEKLLDTAGRVEKYKARLSKKSALAAKAPKKPRPRHSPATLNVAHRGAQRPTKGKIATS